MAKFLTTRDTTSEIEKIINNAKNRLTLISPFVRIPENLFQNLKVASRKVEITLIYGKKELEPEVKSQLEQLDNLSLHFLENLHAKCFYNEESMVITSLNLYNYSESNREMGVLVTAKDDKDVFTAALQEAKRIIELATPAGLTRTESKSHPPKIEQHGYCIRCGGRIVQSPAKPLCEGCFPEWNEWGNPDYEEHYCHTCGRSASTSKAMPQCDSCYAKSRRRR